MKKTFSTALAFVLTLFLALPPAAGLATGDDISAQYPTQSQPQDDEAVPPSFEDAQGDEDGDKDGDESVPDEAEEDSPLNPEETPAPPQPNSVPPAVPENDAEPQAPSGLEVEPLATIPRETPLAPGRYRIRPAVSDTRVLDVASASMAAGANVLIYQSHNGANQLFDVSYDDKGFYTIKSVKSGMVLDVAGANTARGTNVLQYTAHGNANQKWVLTESRDGRGTSVYQLASALAENLMLDVSGGTDANSTNVQVWPRNNGAAQKFYFMPINPNVVSSKTVQDGIYALTSALSSSFALDISGGSTTDGVQLHLWALHGGLPQLFEIKWQSDGFYTIRPLCSGKMLDVSGNQVMATTPVLQWRSHGGDNQRWAIADNGDGTISFIAKNSGLVLAIAGNKAASGAKAQLYYPQNSANQRFRLATASAEPLQEGIFTVAPFVNTAKTIDIQGSGRTSDAKVLVYGAHGGMNQKFQIIRTAASTYAFNSLVSGMFLTANGSRVYQTTGSAGKPSAAQQWKASWNIGGVHLVNVATGQAMAVNANGNEIQAAAANGASSQAFRFAATTPVPTGYYEIKSASGFALDLNGGNAANGTNIQLYTPNKAASQIWKLDLTSDGYYTIANARTGKVVDISGGNTAEGTNVLAWEKNGRAWQKWKPVPSGDGWFYLQSATGTYLSVSGAGDYNKANVFVSSSITKNAQKFRFNASSYTGYFGTYAEVNLTTQKMLFVKDGVLVLECDVVTGAPSMKTPAGTFRVTNKLSPTVLRGPGYAAPVTYWMQFTSNGVGFHDATWQSSFGGNRYRTHGSHGCVNMPKWAAKELYAKISVGDTVKVHY